MKKRTTIIALIVLTLCGALFAMLGANMFFADILGIGGGAQNATLFTTFAVLPVCAFFVVGILYMIRIYKHPNCMKRITRVYSIIVAALGLIGLVFDIISAATIYHSFVSSHPFPGFSIVFLVLNLLLMGVGGSGIYCSIKHLKADEDKVKVNFPYVMKTLGWFLFISLMLYRLGTFLTFPLYVYWRNFYMTFPFYLWLLVPAFLGVVEAMHILGLLDRKKGMILALVGIGLNVVLCGYTVICGINDTMFISSLSQAMPMERLAAKPVELPLHFLAYLGVGIALLIQNKKPKEEAK